MQNNTETKVWNATLYLRLSRDDGDKEESNSITGQRELLRDFIRTRPELREYAVRIDDGFTISRCSSSGGTWPPDTIQTENCASFSAGDTIR